MPVDGEYQAVEEVFCKNMAIAGEYLLTWRLKRSTAKRCQQSSIPTQRNLNVS